MCTLQGAGLTFALSHASAFQSCTQGGFLRYVGAAVGPGTIASGAGAGAESGVEPRSRDRIRERVVGLLDGAETLPGARVGADIRVIQQRQASVGAADLRLTGVAPEAEDLVVIL